MVGGWQPPDWRWVMANDRIPNPRRSGFSLIEILVVIVIIAVISSEVHTVHHGPNDRDDNDDNQDLDQRESRSSRVRNPIVCHNPPPIRRLPASDHSDLSNTSACGFAGNQQPATSLMRTDLKKRLAELHRVPVVD